MAERPATEWHIEEEPDGSVLLWRGARLIARRRGLWSDDVAALRELVALPEEAVASRENARIGQWVKDHPTTPGAISGSLIHQLILQGQSAYRDAALAAGGEPS